MIRIHYALIKTVCLKSLFTAPNIVADELLFNKTDR